MTDSVCTAYESRKQPHDSSSNLRGILCITKYGVHFNEIKYCLLCRKRSHH